MGAALSIAATSALAMGFGRASTSTVLGQTLDFTVVLRQEPDEFVDAECVSAEVTAGDEKLPRERVRVAVEGPADGTERTLRVTSALVISEPVVSVTLGVGCPVRLSRSFTAFVDPPTLNLAQQAADEALPASAPAAQATRTPPESSDVGVATAARAGTPRAAAASAARRTAPPPRRVARAPSVAVRPAAPAAIVPVAPRPASAAVPRARIAAAPAAAAGPRLQLEVSPSPARLAAIEAERAASAAAAATAAATAAAEAASQAAAGEASRVKALEDVLARLKNDSQNNSAELAALRARVQQAETRRFANPLVYALAALTALLAVALLLLLWKRSREQDAQWWSAGAASRIDAAPPSRLDSRLDSAPDSVRPAEAAEPPAALRPQPSISPETRPAVAEPRRPVSVEELIDLEQQAEFFTVLGQDEAAIDLLMNHLRGTGGISPLPYLKLLEIYRRRGERVPYERIRERFNRRFNAYAPEWDADLAASRSLEGYPHVMQRLQALWPNPQQAMDELEELLFRRNEGETFDVPAYGEVLFLYALARDRLESPEAEAPVVDLLLPLDGAPPPPAVPMVSTISLDAKPEVEKPLALDVDVSQMPAANSERAERYEDSDFSFRSDAGEKLRPRRR